MYAFSRIMVRILSALFSELFCELFSELFSVPGEASSETFPTGRLKTTLKNPVL
jgi:hypothetical protein